MFHIFQCLASGRERKINERILWTNVPGTNILGTNNPYGPILWVPVRGEYSGFRGRKFRRRIFQGFVGRIDGAKIYGHELSEGNHRGRNVRDDVPGTTVPRTDYRGRMYVRWTICRRRKFRESCSTWIPLGFLSLNKQILRKYVEEFFRTTKIFCGRALDW